MRERARAPRSWRPRPRHADAAGRPGDERGAPRWCVCLASPSVLLLVSVLALASTMAALRSDARWWRRAWWAPDERRTVPALRAAAALPIPAANAPPLRSPAPKLRAAAPPQHAAAPRSDGAPSESELEATYATLMDRAFHHWYKSFGNVPMDFEPHTPFFDLFAPVVPGACAGGELKRVGGDGDGGKFLCVDGALTAPAAGGASGSSGAALAADALVVYSLGSNNQFRFERDVVALCPRCDVHMFDCFATNYQPDGKRGLAQDKYARVFGALSPQQRARVHFHKLCIGTPPRKADPALWRTYRGAMAELGHAAVAVLKIDIEGGEFDVFNDLGMSAPSAARAARTEGVLPRQILLEAHLWSRRDEKRDRKWYNFVRSAYAVGYLPASREDNVACTFCSEFTLVRPSGSGGNGGAAAPAAAASSVAAALAEVPAAAAAAAPPAAARGSAALSGTEWMAQPAWVAEHVALQRAFRASPSTTPRAPLVYRPKANGMGWGNFIHDIAHHVILAAMLKRPFLMSLEEKDPHGALASLLHPGRIDSRLGGLGGDSGGGGGGGGGGGAYGGDGAALLRALRGATAGGTASTPSTPFVQLSCRKTHIKWHALCGGNHDGSLDRPLEELDATPRTILYSEYSGSLILPLRNSRRFRQWVRTHLGASALDAGGRTGGRGTIALAVRAAFWHVFRPSLRLDALVAPWRARLGASYVAMHVRSGNLEGGNAVEAKSHVDWVGRIAECKAGAAGAMSAARWLLLTDDVPLAHAAAAAAATGIVTTVETGDAFTMANGMHVGKMHLSQHEGGAKRAAVATQSWERCLRDWMLIVYAPGAVLLRNTMASAGSYGRRAAFVAGKACGVKKSAALAVDCGGRFFQELCE